jgi:hypothetical protein
LSQQIRRYAEIRRYAGRYADTQQIRRYADTQIRRYADTQIRRYADRCSPVMSSNQLPEVIVVGFAGSPPSLEDIKAIPEILA